MPKPVCVKCQRFYRPKQNAYAWIEGMPNGNGVAAGLKEPENWSPYKLWNSDLWECPDCETQIIVGHGAGPLSEHYRPDFAEQVKFYGASLQVNDC
jgi:hypothetical protein